MPSGIDHLMINVNDYNNAIGFYAWLMPRIGYPHSRSFSEPTPMTGYYGDSGGVWVVASDPKRRSETFDKGRVKVCARSRFAPRVVIKLTSFALEISSPSGGRILDTLPREYEYRTGYYSVFFTDPDGLKLEVVHYPE